jgi:hypothetical protein
MIHHLVLLKMQHIVGSVVATDSCAEVLEQAEVPEDVPCQKLVMDEENISFEPNTFDLAVSSLK